MACRSYKSRGERKTDRRTDGQPCRLSGIDAHYPDQLINDDISTTLSSSHQLQVNARLFLVNRSKADHVRPSAFHQPASRPRTSLCYIAIDETSCCAVQCKRVSSSPESADLCSFGCSARRTGHSILPRRRDTEKGTATESSRGRGHCFFVPFLKEIVICRERERVQLPLYLIPFAYLLSSIIYFLIMYDHQSLLLHQHTHRTASPQSGTSRQDSSTAQAQSTRSMRASSCSNAANNASIDSAMAVTSPFDSEDAARADNSSSPTTGGVGPSASGPYDRKRKCDAADRLPRTPLPTLSSSPRVLTPRPRSATYSSGIPSGSGSSSIRHNPAPSSSLCTASRPDALEEDGNQPKDRSRFPLDVQDGFLELPSSRDNQSFSSSLSPVPSSSLAARRRSIQASKSEMAKRPRLESSASMDHLHVPGEPFTLQVPTHLDFDSNLSDDAPSGPPSASFSNLTITQPPSPAYAAFSLQTPAPSCLPSKSSPQQFTFAETSSAATSEQAVTLSNTQLFQSATCQSRPSSHASHRRDKSPARTARRRLRRAASLPLTEEMTLARSSLGFHHQRPGSSLSSKATNATLHPSAIITDANTMGVDQRSIEQREAHAEALQESGPSACEGSSSSSSVRESHDASINDSDSTLSCQRGVHPNFDEGVQESALTGPLAHQHHERSEFLSSSQLAAIHQFNMPKMALQRSVLSSLYRTPPVPYPSRSQSYAQAQRRLPSTNPKSHGDAVVPFGVMPAATTLLHIAPVQHLAPVEQTKPLPTASVPAYVPPIAKETLRELDLQEILQCRQLRHDIVFDANLMFRPNFDGDRYVFTLSSGFETVNWLMIPESMYRGDRKREAADRYWTAVTRELETGCRCTTYSFPPSATARMMGKPSVPLPCICTNVASPQRRYSLHERLPSRIGPLIQELRDILLALLPSPGQDARAQDSPSRKASKPSNCESSTNAQMIIDTLDPELIAQEVAHGVLDVSSLAAFFGQILKSHCAPMRDEIVERMVQTIKEGGQANNMYIVGTGLRMCFEILELMKLDIANHQLRMLRPYLLETAAEFEYKTFLHLKKKRSQGEFEASEMITEGPPVSKTKMWLASVSHREGNSDCCSLVIDGILELLFNPFAETSVTNESQKTSQSAEIPTLDRARRPRSQALPHSSQVPETLQLDIYRLQLFHGDTVDLCIVHLLLLLYRQLCLSNKIVPTSEDVESIRRQIWVIMSEVNTAAATSLSLGGRRSPPTTPQSIKKLGSAVWREGMKDVLLQIARFSSRNSSEDRCSTSVPDSTTLSVLDSWMNNNLRADSKLVS